MEVRVRVEVALGLAVIDDVGDRVSVGVRVNVTVLLGVVVQVTVVMGADTWLQAGNQLLSTKRIRVNLNNLLFADCEE